MRSCVLFCTALAVSGPSYINARMSLYASLCPDHAVDDEHVAGVGDEVVHAGEGSGVQHWQGWTTLGGPVTVDQLPAWVTTLAVLTTRHIVDAVVARVPSLKHSCQVPQVTS